jgi:hypothetical protein
MSNRIHSIEYSDLECCLYKQQWTTFYISIGGKWNQDNVTHTKITRTNAPLQMIPQFLNSPIGEFDQQTMVVVFDDFSNKQNTLHNINIIQYMIQNKPNLHVFLVNKMMCVDTFNDCWSILQPLLYKRKVPPSRFSIVNYVKYMNTPNMQETKNTTISSFIYDVIKEDPKYCDCLYEWLGYNYYLYNYICNYKIIHKNYLRYGLDILHRLLENYDKCGYLSEYIQINNLNVITILNHLKPLDTDLPAPTSLHIEIEPTINTLLHV